MRLEALIDDRLPADQSYDLTSFGGPIYPEPVACAGAADADGSWYYSRNAQRFPCGQRVRIVNEARSACVILEVADFGTHVCVEEEVGRPLFSVSPLAAEHLVGRGFVGFEEGEGVFGAPVDPDNPLGPCDAQLAGPSLDGFIGGPCRTSSECAYADALCLGETDGWPGGACSLECETVCPDREGPFAHTACVAMEGGARRCLARCDFTLFPSGCREGYDCERRPHLTGDGAERWVCVPSTC